MKAIRFATALIACLAMLAPIGFVGAYEVGQLTTPRLFALCGASLGLFWASAKIYNKVQDTKRG